MSYERREEEAVKAFMGLPEEERVARYNQVCRCAQIERVEHDGAGLVYFASTEIITEDELSARYRDMGYELFGTGALDDLAPEEDEDGEGEYVPEDDPHKRIG